MAFSLETNVKSPGYSYNMWFIGCLRISKDTFIYIFGGCFYYVGTMVGTKKGLLYVIP